MTSNLDSVYLLVGEAIHESQVLESILVEQNIVHELKTDKLNEEKIKKYKEKIENDGMGTLLQDWRKKDPEHEDVFDYLRDIKEERNYIAHHIFKHDPPKSCAELIDIIERVIDRLKSAQIMIYTFDPTLPEKRKCWV